MLVKKSFFSFCFIILLNSCAMKSPVLELHSFSYSEPSEIREGEELAKKLLYRSKLSSDIYAMTMVNKVGKRLVNVVKDEMGTAPYKWDFFVLEKQSKANAFCLAGGKVFVYSGLFPYLDNEDELALVLAHEMIHTLAHHQVKRKKRRIVSKIGKSLVSIVSFLNPFSLPFVKKKEINHSEALVNELIFFPYTQSQEYEADALGLELMKKAGYNPKAALTFWSKFLKERALKPEYCSTHPSTKHRLERFDEILQ